MKEVSLDSGEKYGLKAPLYQGRNMDLKLHCIRGEIWT
jgi:hypothetical protein